MADSKSSSDSKRLVDARESEVGDLVELAQRREDRQPDLVRLDLGGAGGADLLLDPLGEQRQLVLPDGPALAGLADAGRRSCARLNGSVTPERLTTVRLAVSTVLKRRPHCGQTRRRRIATPSSVLRESTTRESAERQNGQFTTCLASSQGCGRRARLLWTTRRRPVEEPGD